MLTTRLITRNGLVSVLKDLIEFANKCPGVPTYQQCFSTLDGRVQFYTLLSPAFGYDSADKLVKLYICRSCCSMRDDSDPEIRIGINCRRWEFSIGFETDADEESGEMEEDIPEYAKQFRKLINPCDECGSLFSMYLSDDPTEKEIDRILQSMRRIQMMKACGCGNPVSPMSLSPEANLCIACQLTMSEDDTELTPEDSCPICLEDILPAHVSVMQCCGIVLHKGCRQEIEKNRDKCIHCQQLI